MSSKRRTRNKSPTKKDVRRPEFDSSSLSAKIPSYNSLFDSNMRHYYENKTVQRLLYKSGLIDQKGRVINLEKNKSKLFIIEQEFKLAEKAEYWRLREEQDIRKRLSIKRQHALDEARKFEKISKMKEDRRIRQEIVRARALVSNVSPLKNRVRAEGSSYLNEDPYEADSQINHLLGRGGGDDSLRHLDQELDLEIFTSEVDADTQGNPIEESAAFEVPDSITEQEAHPGGSGSRAASVHSVHSEAKSSVAASFAPAANLAERESSHLVGKPEKKRKNVVIMGPPAAGKGTQCEMIKDCFGFIHLSTGDLLRDVVARETEIGLQVKETMESGGLVDDDVMLQLVKDRLAADDCKEHGVLFDGFPRTPSQALALQEAGVIIDKVILLECPDDVVVQRCIGRRLHPATGKIYHVDFNPPPEDIADEVEQRADDTEDVIRARLDTFQKNIAFMKDHYESILDSFDNTLPKDDVYASIETFLKK